MKKNNNQPKRVEKIRQILATTLACIVVLGVPILSVMQFWHLLPSAEADNRQATTLPAFQTRAIDNTTTAPQLFKQPLISVTFDDGYESSYRDAFPTLQKRGIHTTQYLLSGVEKDPLYLSWDQIKQIQKGGHEIGCHTVSHPDLVTVSDKEVMSQLTDCKSTLEKEIGKPVTNFASPYGSANNRVRAEIKKVFASQRNTDGDSSNGVTFVDVNLAQGFDPMNIIGMTVKKDTPVSEIQALIDFAVKNNGWLVLTYHQADDGPSQYGLKTSDLDKQMEVLQKSNVRIVTVQQAMASYKASK